MATLALRRYPFGKARPCFGFCQSVNRCHGMVQLRVTDSAEWHALRYSEGRGYSHLHALRSTSGRATHDMPFLNHADAMLSLSTLQGRARGCVLVNNRGKK